MNIKATLKKIIYELLYRFSPRSQGVSILMYHSVADNDAFFSVSPSTFRRQIAYLHKAGIRVERLSDIVNRIRTGEPLERSVVVTFDDGYLDNYTEAFPVLREYAVPASIFVTTGKLGGTMTERGGTKLPMLNIDQLKELHESNLMSVYPHTRTHTEVPGLTKEELNAEISGSRADIESVGMPTADIFAYPRGKYDVAAETFLKSHGFRAAVTVRRGVVSARTDPFLLPRYSIDSETSWSQFKSIVAQATWPLDTQ